MSRFVSEPNLPDSCSTLIYGKKYAGILEKSLDSLHIESVLLPDNPDIDRRLSGHADLSVLHAGGERLFLAPYLKGSAFASQLQSRGAALDFPAAQQEHVYPRDAQLNCCVVGKHVICNPKTAARDIVDYLTIADNKSLLPVRQGYSRCAVCVVDGGSVITSDRGIAAAARAEGLRVLLIQEGHIRLDGYAYGFIGGAAFKLASDKLAFTGSLDLHPDRDAIRCFLAERGVEPVYLSHEPLFDIGSAIPLFEN